MAKKILPAIVTLMSTEPYDDGTLSKEFDAFLNSGGKAHDLDGFQEYMDYVTANQTHSGKLDHELIRVASSRVMVRRRYKSTPEDFATPDIDFLPVSGQLIQKSIEYILLLQLDNSKFLVTEGWNVGKLVGGEKFDAYSIEVGNIDIINYQVLD